MNVSTAAALFSTLMRRPPPAMRRFWCRCCRRELRGATVCLDERGRAWCGDCVGREAPEKPEKLPARHAL